ncbi:MAG TPA: hypothetical protein ENN34_08900 [Deltaproteobacteria bacterium]|nr:hypothetical protein [Deltaproteobacteria bacterium]
MKKALVVAGVVVGIIAVFFLVDTFFLQKKPIDVPMEGSPPTVEEPEVPADATVPENADTLRPKRVSIDEIKPEKTFEDYKADLAVVCRELDTRDYIMRYKLREGTCKKFHDMLEKLAYKPPVVSGETRDLYTLLSNAAHFYRVLGKDDIRLIKDVITHEHATIEPTMALVYQYLITGSREETLSVNIGQLYEYAGFFLETLGGKSYLYRRDATVRTLTRYYSVLILDQANREQMNPYGIDIIPHLKLLEDDIAAHSLLAGRAEYLEVLKGIEASSIR